jgi:hypothetical protein
MPLEPHAVIEQVHRGFERTRRPGDAFLVGSHEGCEPEETVGLFRGREWRSLDPKFLDQHYSALSFFSEGALRYFIPAYIVADIRGQLQTADPVFALTHGFDDWSSSIEAAGRSWNRRYGPSVLLNPQRYGAMTIGDYARFRLSVFTREEASAVVLYLRYAAERDDGGTTRRAVEAALRTFWLDRARHAPTWDELDDHLRGEDEFQRSLR